MALAAGDQIANGRAQNALGIDAIVLIKAFVLRSKNSLLQDIGNVLEADDRTPLFTKFADQIVIGRVNPKRDFWPVVRQDLK